MHWLSQPLVWGVAVTIYCTIGLWLFYGINVTYERKRGKPTAFWPFVVLQTMMLIAWPLLVALALLKDRTPKE